MVIYKTTCLINGKIYIGQDTKNDPKYLGSGITLRSAIQKHGFHNFIKVILCRCASQKALDLMEAHFICKRKSYDPKIGYNILRGTANKFASGSPMKDKRVSQKVADSLRRLYRTEKGRQLIVKSNAKRMIAFEANGNRERLSELGRLLKGPKNPNYGHRWSAEKRAEMSAKKAGMYEGERNPNYGNKWEAHKKSHLSEHIRTQYASGRVNPMTDRVRITDGIVNTTIPKGTPLPDGFRFGMKARNG